MNVRKDEYLEIARHAADRTTLNMLRQNREFYSPRYFQQIFSKRYPLLTRFKYENEDWKQFYLRMIKHIYLLEEEYKFSYVAIRDLDPETLYNNAVSQEFSEYDFENYIESLSEYYYTVAYNERYPGGILLSVDPTILPGRSVDSLLNHQKILQVYGIDFKQTDIERMNEDCWLAFIFCYDPTGENNDYHHENSRSSNNQQSALNYLFNTYMGMVDYYATTIENQLTNPVPRDEILRLDLNLAEDWDNKELFTEKVNNTKDFFLIIDRDYPHKQHVIFNFQIVKCTIKRKI